MCKAVQRSKMWLMRVKQKKLWNSHHKRTTSKYESLEQNVNNNKKKNPSKW